MVCRRGSRRLPLELALYDVLPNSSSLIYLKPNSVAGLRRVASNTDAGTSIQLLYLERRLNSAFSKAVYSIFRVRYFHQN
jgi:hypothetical protein